MEKPTVGSVSTGLLLSDTVSDHSAGEQMQEQLSEYESHIFQCVDRGKSSLIGDFYVVVITKRERLMPNVFRQYFFPRISCPTPDYDQTVYKYHHKDERIEFLWVVPSKQAAEELRDNKVEVDLSLSQLLKFVLEFFDGTLDKKARVLNKEAIV